MKRAVLAALCIIAFCCFGLALKTGPVRAYQPGYEVIDGIVDVVPVIDGNWTTPDEWTNATEKQLVGSLNATFRLKYDSNYPEWVNQYYLIEFFDDTTNDAGDYWQICYAAATELGGTPIGGTTPQTDCHLWTLQYHDPSTGTAYYKGTGTNPMWMGSANFTMPTDIEWANTISASPLDSNPHWIAEIKIEHLHFNIVGESWIRIAAYDASADTGAAWPIGSPYAPDDWGLMATVDYVVPEGFSIGVVVLLTSVAVLVAARLRTWSRPERRRSGQREI